MLLHLTRGSISTLIYSVKLPNIFIVAVIYGAQFTHQQQPINEKRDHEFEGDWEVCTGGYRGRNGKEEMRLYYNLKIIIKRTLC